MRKFIVFILIISIFSCKHSETKKIISYYNNGQPKIVKYFKNKDDSLTYRKEVFYKSGKQFYIGYIDKGTKVDDWIWWYENGNKKDQCKYENGFYVDTVFHWYENGQLRQIEILGKRKVRTDGCCDCDGTIIRWYANGKLKEIFTSYNDKFEGVHETFEENGSWKIRTYHNDILNGPASEHFIDSTGNVTIVIGQYENGKESGLWKWFDKDSILSQTALYVNGKTNGEYIKYYPNGKMKEKGTLVNGNYNDRVNYFDENSKIIKTEFYKNGKKIH